MLNNNWVKCPRRRNYVKYIFNTNSSQPISDAKTLLIHATKLYQRTTSSDSINQSLRNIHRTATTTPYRTDSCSCEPSTFKPLARRNSCYDKPFSSGYICAIGSSYNGPLNPKCNAKINNNIFSIVNRNSIVSEGGKLTNHRFLVQEFASFKEPSCSKLAKKCVCEPIGQIDLCSNMSPMVQRIEIKPRIRQLKCMTSVKQSRLICLLDERCVRKVKQIKAISRQHDKDDDMLSPW